MDITVIQECTQRSLEGAMSFPEVVQKLMGIGVESYHVDLLRLEKTYYMPSGESYVEKIHFSFPPVEKEFSGDKVKEAILTIQSGKIQYLEFLERIMQAGTSFYVVFLQGKKVIYFGRKGDFHIENFPKK